MGDEQDVSDVGFASFRQQFANGPQRRRLGYEISHADALRILGDTDRLAAEYGVWRANAGKAPCEELPPEQQRSLSRLFSFLRRPNSF